MSPDPANEFSDAEFDARLRARVQRLEELIPSGTTAVARPARVSARLRGPSGLGSLTLGIALIVVLVATAGLWRQSQGGSAMPTATPPEEADVCTLDPTISWVTDPVPAMTAAVHAAVASLGLPVARIVLQPDPFDCLLWPGAASQVLCQPTHHSRHGHARLGAFHRVQQGRGRRDRVPGADRAEPSAEPVVGRDGRSLPGPSGRFRDASGIDGLTHAESGRQRRLRTARA